MGVIACHHTLIVAETVFCCATVELSVPVATPLAFVVPLGCVSVFPAPSAHNVTVAPLIGFPLPSFAVTVIVEMSLPFATIGVCAVTVDCEVDTGPTVTVTVGSALVTATVLIVAPIVVSVPAKTPVNVAVYVPFP
jgi:hypothetical protein